MQKRAIRRTDQHVFEHHIVGQQNVRRIGQNPVAVLAAVLPCIARKCQRAVRPILLEILQRLELTVDQRIRRIHNERADRMFGRLVLEHVVHDWHEVGQALARSGAGGNKVRLVLSSSDNGLGLMFVKANVRPEKVRSLFPNRASDGEVGERIGWLIGGIELQHSVGPEFAARQHVLDEALDTLIANVDKALHVLAIFADDMVAQAKNIEGHFFSSAMLSANLAGHRPDPPRTSANSVGVIPI